MRRVIINIIISVIGMILGYSAFICFCMFYFNIEAGLWAFFSGVKATLCLILHYHDYKQSIYANFSRNRLYMLADIGFVGMIIGLGLTVFYIFLEIYWHAPTLPVEKSIIIRTVWSFMWMKWGILLNHHAKKYQKALTDGDLFTETPNFEET